MAYQVLARKWRPRNFAEMVGQEHVVRALGNALDHDRLHHAYLFTGTRGVGKTTLARILAKSLNCETGVTSSPCGTCGVCREIDEGRFVDLLEVDAASKTGVDDTRELLENVPYAPVAGRYKVYLIDEVHMFSGHSFNALLKTLEEPPPHVKFLLATTDPQKVPVTVLSRCLQFNLKRLPVDQIEGQLRRILDAEGVDHEPAALAVLARSADGSLRDALSLLDQAIAFGGGAVVEAQVQAMLGVVASDRLPTLLDAVARGDAPAALQVIADMAGYAPDFGGLLRELVMVLHRVALLQQVPGAAQDSWPNVDALRCLASALAPDEVQLHYQIALVGQRDLPLAPDERSGFEMVVLRMLAFRPSTREEVGDSPARRAVAARPAVAPEAPSGAGSNGLAPPPSPAASGRLPEQPVETATPPPGGAAALEDWGRVLQHLDLKGMAVQLARNVVVGAWDGRRLELRVDPSCRSLLGSLAEQRLVEAVQVFAGSPVKVVFAVGDADAETPARREARAKQADQDALARALRDDPAVQAIQEKFDAEIEPDSIGRVD
jgi:DNA polymerase-3 subunit gamma/tau